MKKFLTLSALGIMILSCGPKKEQAVEKETEEIVKTTILSMVEVDRSAEYSTNLLGYETMDVAPSIQGKIEKIFVEVGDKVKKDQLLVRMDQTQLNAQELQYSNLVVDMGRIEALKNEGATSQQTYDQTKLSLDQTKENLDFTRENTFVKADFSGVIEARNYENGELFAGQPILVLTQINTLKALVNIPETYFPLVKKGIKVNLSSDIYPNQIFPAEIDIIYPTINPTTHTFTVQLKIPNSDELLRPGMYTRVDIALGQVKSLLIPYQSALKLIGTNERYVFVNDNGYAKRIFVELGERYDENVEVISDELKEGMEIVTIGQGKLIDGVKLKVTK